MAGTSEGGVKGAARRLGIDPAEYLANVEAGLKWCSGHKAWHPRTHFAIDRSRGDGLKTTCSDTGRPDSKLRRRQMATLSKAWCRRCKSWVDAAETHAGLCRAHQNEYDRERYATDPDFRASRKSRAAAYRRGVAPLPTEGAERLRIDWGGGCAYCPESAQTVDHVVPVSRGGRTTVDNVVPACRSCNSSKKASDPQPWIQRGMTLRPKPWGSFVELAAENLIEYWGVGT